MTLPATAISPMLAELRAELPRGDYQYEPKWDGFRALVFRDGDRLELISRHQRPLARYFPELVAGLAKILPNRVILDGEIVIAGDDGLDFDALLLRLHPSASRVAMLAQTIPASFIAFDLIALADRDLRTAPTIERRAVLASTFADARKPLRVTPASRDFAVADEWLRRFERAGIDGVVAKALDLPYIEGERVMIKVKPRRTADCVVGGYRTATNGSGVASLLLGLYDDAARLRFVGVASGFAATLRAALASELAPLRLSHRAPHPWRVAERDDLRIPGGPSRWNAGKNLAWNAIRPVRVVEVSYDRMQGTRFRHATKFVRWRPDRTPESCTFDQLVTGGDAPLAELWAETAAAVARPSHR